jgi:hypothetical protein
MAKLYRQHVLKEQPPSVELVQLGPLPAKAKAATVGSEETREEVGSFGD